MNHWLITHHGNIYHFSRNSIHTVFIFVWLWLLSRSANMAQPHFHPYRKKINLVCWCQRTHWWCQCRCQTSVNRFYLNLCGMSHTSGRSLVLILTYRWEKPLRLAVQLMVGMHSRTVQLHMNLCFVQLCFSLSQSERENCCVLILVLNLARTLVMGGMTTRADSNYSFTWS